jgi:hypothetical protein
LVVAIEVGDIGHFQFQAAVFGLGHLGARGYLQFAEIAAEGELGLVVEVLVVEDQDGVAVHAGLDGRDLLCGQRPGQVDPGRVPGEVRGERGDVHRLSSHGSYPAVYRQSGWHCQ